MSPVTSIQLVICQAILSNISYRRFHVHDVCLKHAAIRKRNAGRSDFFAWDFEFSHEKNARLGPVAFHAGNPFPRPAQSPRVQDWTKTSCPAPLLAAKASAIALIILNRKVSPTFLTDLCGGRRGTRSTFSTLRRTRPARSSPTPVIQYSSLYAAAAALPCYDL